MAAPHDPFPGPSAGAILAALPFGAVLFQGDGSIFCANPEAYRALGLEGEDACKSVETLIPGVLAHLGTLLSGETAGRHSRPPAATLASGIYNGVLTPGAGSFHSASSTGSITSAESKRSAQCKRRQRDKVWPPLLSGENFSTKNSLGCFSESNQTFPGRCPVSGGGRAPGSGRADAGNTRGRRGLGEHSESRLSSSIPWSGTGSNPPPGGYGAQPSPSGGAATGNRGGGCPVFRVPSASQDEQGWEYEHGWKGRETQGPRDVQVARAGAPGGVHGGNEPSDAAFSDSLAEGPNLLTSKLWEGLLGVQRRAPSQSGDPDAHLIRTVNSPGTTPARGSSPACVQGARCEAHVPNTSLRREGRRIASELLCHEPSGDDVDDAPPAAAPSPKLPDSQPGPRQNADENPAADTGAGGPAAVDRGAILDAAAERARRDGCPASVHGRSTGAPRPEDGSPGGARGEAASGGGDLTSALLTGWPGHVADESAGRAADEPTRHGADDGKEPLGTVLTGTLTASMHGSEAAQAAYGGDGVAPKPAVTCTGTRNAKAPERLSILTEGSSSAAETPPAPLSTIVTAPSRVSGEQVTLHVQEVEPAAYGWLPDGTEASVQKAKLWMATVVPPRGTAGNPATIDSPGNGSGLMRLLESSMLSNATTTPELRSASEGAISLPISELEDNQQVMDAVLRTTADAIVLIDAKGLIRRWNPAAEEMFGWKAEEIMGKNISLIMPPFHAERHDDYLRNYLAGGEPKIIGSGQELECVHKDGCMIPVALTVSEVILNKSIYFSGIMRDITDEVAARDALMMEKERLQAVVESTVDGIVTINEQGIIATFNAAAEAMFQYSTAEVLGQNVKLLMPPDIAEKHDGYLERYNMTGEANIIGNGREVEAMRKDGTRFLALLSVSEVKTDTMHLFTATIRDLTNEQLLSNMLPTTISRRLKTEPLPISDGFDNVSVMFADVVGFTALSSVLEPRQVVTFLNEMFAIFDGLVDKYRLEKIKTIGDCYMVVSGLPTPRKDHAEAIGRFALEMLEALVQYNVQSKPLYPLGMRVGINCGPVVAGVVGTRKYLYDLWGDAVNVASRMESTGKPGKIQVTDSFKREAGNVFEFVKRGDVNVKGKGKMTTYFLTKLASRVPERMDSFARRTLTKKRSNVSDLLTQARRGTIRSKCRWSDTIERVFRNGTVEIGSLSDEQTLRQSSRDRTLPLRSGPRRLRSQGQLLSIGLEDDLSLQVEPSHKSFSDAQTLRRGAASNRWSSSQNISSCSIRSTSQAARSDSSLDGSFSMAWDDCMFRRSILYRPARDTPPPGPHDPPHDAHEAEASSVASSTACAREEYAPTIKSPSPYPASSPSPYARSPSPFTSTPEPPGLVGCERSQPYTLHTARLSRSPTPTLQQKRMGIVSCFPAVPCQDATCPDGTLSPGGSPLPTDGPSSAEAPQQSAPRKSATTPTPPIGTPPLPQRPLSMKRSMRSSATTSIHSSFQDSPCLMHSLQDLIRSRHNHGYVSQASWGLNSSSISSHVSSGLPSSMDSSRFGRPGHARGSSALAPSPSSNRALAFELGRNGRTASAAKIDAATVQSDSSEYLSAGSVLSSAMGPPSAGAGAPEQREQRKDAAGILGDNAF